MAISYVGGNSNRSENKTHNIDLSGLGLQEGDLVLVANGSVSNGDIDAGVTTSGFAELVELFSNDGADTNLSLNWKIMRGTPDTSVTCKASQSSGRGSVSVAVAFRGVDTTTPFDVTYTTATGGNAAIPDPASITPTTSGAWVVVFGAGTVNDSAVTAPSGFSNQVALNSTAVVPITVAAASMAWTSGAVDPAAWTDWTAGDADQSWAAVTVALRPASGGSGAGIVVGAGVLFGGRCFGGRVIA